MNLMRVNLRGIPAPATIRNLLLLLIALALPLHASLLDSEAGLPPMKYYSATDYLGHPQIFDTIRGSDGFLYLANVMGMIEFDGIRWQQHKAPVTFLYSLAEDHQGRIWAGGRESIGYYTKNPDGAWVYQSVMDLLPESNRNIGYSGPIEIVGDDVYLATGAGVLRVRDGQGKLWPVTDGQSGGFITQIAGALYWMDSGKLLKRLVGEEMVTVAALEDGQRNTRVFGVARDSQPILWLFGNLGAFVINEETKRFEHVTGALDTLLSTTRVNDVQALDDGTIAVGTGNQGLVIASADGQRIRILKQDSGLPDNMVLGLCTDKEGGLWVGLNSGVVRIAYNSPVTLFNATNGPTPGTIDNWFRYHDRLYAATADGLYQLQAPDYLNGTGARFIRILDNLTHVHAMAEIHGHMIFSSTEGVMKLSADHSWSRAGENLPAEVKQIYASRFVPDRYYAVGAQGLAVLQWVNDQFVLLASYPQVRLSYYGVEDDNGDFWAASYASGFWRLPAANRITDWSEVRPEQYFRDHGLPTAMVWTTATPGSRGPIFFTDAGGFKFDPATRTFSADDRYPINGSDYSLSPTVITPDGATWGSAFGDNVLNSPFPVVRFAKDSPAGTLPVPLSAIQAVGFAGIAAIARDFDSPHGAALWMRGYGDHIRLDLNALGTKTSAWQPLVKELRQGKHSWTANTPKGAPLKLGFSREPLTFLFANPDFQRLGDVKFQSRLVGYSDHWSDPSTIPQASFTNLEGGPFTLEVRGIDSSGQTSQVGRLTFSVLPPWHHRPLAYTLYGVLALGAFAGVMRWRLRAADRERNRLENLVGKRTMELAEAKEAAEAANRAKSTFLANMSHELRTPLNGVLGYARIMLRDRQLPPANREQARIVANSGEHLLKMINEVLDFSKIEAGKIELRPAPYHLPGLLRDIEVALAPRAEARGLAFKVIADPRLPGQCLGDAQKLRQVIDNLLSNAVKFTPKGEVRLEVNLSDKAHGRVTFAVRDTGVGLSASDQEKLFTPFHQAADGRPPEPGTGLGLSICQRLVALMGGTIEVESEIGHGSCFRFTLPIERMDSAHPFPVAGETGINGYTGPRRSVLVVDDVEVNRNLLRDLLGPLGFHVDIAADATSALALLNSHAPDIIILDLRMPGIDGLELTRRIRAKSAVPKPAIILTSASVLSFDPQTAFDAGCDDFLPKPFREDELFAVIGRRLRLDWIMTDKAVESTNPVTPIVSAADAASLESLRDAAACGDIKRIKSLLAEMRAAQSLNGALLDKLDGLAATYQMDLLRRSIDELPARN